MLRISWISGSVAVSLTAALLSLAAPVAGSIPAALAQQPGNPPGNLQTRPDVPRDPGLPKPPPELRDHGLPGAPGSKGPLPGSKPSPRSADSAKQPKPIPKSMRPPGGNAVPEGGAQRAALLAELYAYLATATDETVAKRTAAAIEQVWHVASGDTVALLIERASKASGAKQPKLAIDLYDRAVRLAPDDPQVFIRRGTEYFEQGDLERSLGDLRRALALDPNHYRALDRLAQILREVDRKKEALAVYRKLYEVYPFYPGVKSTIEELSRDVEGHGA